MCMFPAWFFLFRACVALYFACSAAFGYRIRAFYQHLGSASQDCSRMRYVYYTQSEVSWLSKRETKWYLNWKYYYPGCCRKYRLAFHKAHEAHEKLTVADQNENNTIVLVPYEANKYFLARQMDLSTCLALNKTVIDDWHKLFDSGFSNSYFRLAILLDDDIAHWADIRRDHRSCAIFEHHDEDHNEHKLSVTFPTLNKKYWLIDHLGCETCAQSAFLQDVDNLVADGVHTFRLSPVHSNVVARCERASQQTSKSASHQCPTVRYAYRESGDAGDKLYLNLVEGYNMFAFSGPKEVKDKGKAVLVPYGDKKYYLARQTNISKCFVLQGDVNAQGTIFLRSGKDDNWIDMQHAPLGSCLTFEVDEHYDARKFNYAALNNREETTQQEDHSEHRLSVRLPEFDQKFWLISHKGAYDDHDWAKLQKQTFELDQGVRLRMPSVRINGSLWGLCN
eukprot:TRINITY_DN7415_c0_g1_i1.p1 TRINITY_DN7415_c0_g1~~TRINITY_DN7415_c0_g1_i1.p1  ORF type:complete len:450 (-),score=28.47 TRINITY_DN7415_c0_g1_i1:183-1532(-)